MWVLTCILLKYSLVWYKWRTALNMVSCKCRMCHYWQEWFGKNINNIYCPATIKKLKLFMYPDEPSLLWDDGRSSRCCGGPFPTSYPSTSDALARSTLIFELCLNFDLNYTPVKFRDYSYSLKNYTSLTVVAGFYKKKQKKKRQTQTKVSCSFIKSGRTIALFCFCLGVL